MAPTPSKNQAIKAALAATKARRKTQVCCVYELKVKRAKLNAKSRAHFVRLFLEAKWLYNWVLSQPHLFLIDTAVQSVPGGSSLKL